MANGAVPYCIQVTSLHEDSKSYQLARWLLNKREIFPLLQMALAGLFDEVAADMMETCKLLKLGA
jgi:hypothetical protein